MRSTYFKNFMLSAGPAVLSFILLAIVMSVLTQNFLVGDRHTSMTQNAEEVARSAIAFGEKDNLGDWELRMHITTLASSTEESIFIVDNDGVIVSCSDRNLYSEYIGATLGSTFFEAIKDETRDHVSNLGGVLDAQSYIVSQAIISGGETWGYAVIAYDSSRIFETFQTFFAIFFLVSSIVLTIAVLITMVTTKRQTAPINEMAAAAKKFGHGDFSVRIRDRGRTDEIGALTAAFNTMAESLEKSEERRSEFIANVSHELKTPMTTISGFADGILDGTIPPERERQYLETISSETKRLNRMVRGMLELSKIQADDPLALRHKSFDISEILILTLLSLEGKINDKHLDIDISLPETHFIVLGDGDSITQVAYNLLDNAIKFSPERGTICLSLWKQEDKAYVSVKNSGRTIPEAQLSLIFDRFHKLDRSRSEDRDGVGLGLYIVKTILGNHGEDISVTSSEGVTEFVFTLTPARK